MLPVKSLLNGNELVNHLSPISSWVIHDMKTSSTTLGPEGKLETDLYLKRREFIAGTWYKSIGKGQRTEGAGGFTQSSVTPGSAAVPEAGGAEGAGFGSPLVQVAAATAAVRLATQHPGRTWDWLPLLLGNRP